MKRRSKKPNRILEYRLDELFSKLVRERAEHRCEKCHKLDGKMDCSHLYGRRMRSVRFDPENAACHCTTCHRWLTERPIEFAEWIVNHLGRERADALRLRAHKSLTRTPSQRRDLYEAMKAEFARMKELRAQGVTGRIEFMNEGRGR